MAQYIPPTMSDIISEYTRYKQANLSPERQARFFKAYPEFKHAFEGLDKSTESSLYSIKPEDWPLIKDQVDPSQAADIFTTPAGYVERFKVKNFSNSIPDTISYLQKRFPGHAFISHEGEILSKPINEPATQWKPMDPGVMASLTNFPELMRDVGDVILDVPAEVAKAAISGVAATGAALTTKNPALAIGAYGTAQGGLSGLESLARQKIGQEMGINQGVNPQAAATQGVLSGGLSSLFAGVSPGKFLLKGQVPEDLKNAMAPYVQKVLNISPNEYALLPDEQVAKVISDKFQSVIPQLAKKVIKPIAEHATAGLSGANIDNVKKYLAKAGLGLSGKDLPITDYEKNKLAEELQNLGGSLLQSGKFASQRDFAKVNELINKEGVSSEEIFNELQRMYQGMLNDAGKSATPEGMQTALNNAKTLKEWTSSILGKDFAEEPSKALMHDVFAKTVVPASEESLPSYLSREEARGQGAFNMTAPDLRAFRERLKSITNTSIDTTKPSDAVQAAAKNLATVTNKSIGEQVPGFNEALGFSGRLKDIAKYTEPLTNPMEKKGTSEVAARTFAEMADKGGVYPKLGMEKLAEIPVKTGAPIDLARFQALKQIQDTLQAAKAPTQLTKKLYNLYMPEAVLGAGDIVMQAGGVANTALQGVGQYLSPYITKEFTPQSEDTLNLDLQKKLLQMKAGK